MDKKSRRALLLCALVLLFAGFCALHMVSHAQTHGQCHVCSLIAKALSVFFAAYILFYALALKGCAFTPKFYEPVCRACLSPASLKDLMLN